MLKARAANAGFSLVELLITLVIGSLFIGAVASLVGSQIRSSVSGEIAQRVRDNSNRLNYFIQTEASEASAVGTGNTIVGCGGGTSLFDFTIPLPTGAYRDPLNVVRTYYYLSGGDLRRCGPSILRNGTLDYGTIVDNIVSRNTTLTLVTCQTVTTGIRTVAYQTTYNDAPYVPPCSIARAKSFFVVD